jgi:predicted aldo/keto reductase-like oxidoreductase
MTDEAAGMKGKRIRTWDTCMAYLYSLEASGHNPRQTKSHRYRNRIGHKFSYFPATHGGAYLCTGCGRCVKSCPAGMDMRKILKALVQAAPETAAEAGAETGTETKA